MPTVLRIGPYPFFFFSGDRGEPKHVHVARDDDEAKFWLGPVSLHENAGFRSAELWRITGLVEANEATLLKIGMATSASETRQTALAESVSVTDDELVISLLDGRTLSVPLAWYPRLSHGTSSERANLRLIGRGVGIHWPDLDEDISVAHALAGVPSGENAISLERWLGARRAAAQGDPA